MLKTSFFLGSEERGPAAIPLFTAADSYFEKVAAPALLPEVTKYINTLRPRPNAQYNLLNAMGAGEFWSSNVNGDMFPEEALIHAPDDWTGNPLLDKEKARTWSYGYPTFYFAHPYAHHRNKDASRAFGEVELALWNPRMHRVELVTRVDKDKCEEFGGVGVWDKLKAGQYPDVSMGCKVPYDTCSICLDWKEYAKALATYRPEKHASPGTAALEYHRALKARTGKGIRGLSITRADYCVHALKEMNRILPDGRKVFVFNDYPKFFDISFVFIGADKTAKVMMKVADDRGRKFFYMPSAELAEKLGWFDGDGIQEKTASVEDELKLAFLGKDAKQKKSEIKKDTIPSQFASKAVPLLTSQEKDLPKEVLDALASRPLGESLATTTALGILLRPREFQRVVLTRSGQKGLADDLDERGETFSRSDESDPTSMAGGGFNEALAKLLLPLLSARSALGPHIEKRVTIIIASSPKGASEKRASSLSLDLMRKIASAYNGYRKAVLGLSAEVQETLGRSGLSDAGLKKLAQVPVNELFTSLSAAYLKNAFWDEVGDAKQASADVERGFPSRNTWNTPTLDGGTL
jgi:hypothetical protein